MITGFETETAQLSNHEAFTLLPIFTRCLKDHVGKSKAVTNAQIVKGMRACGHSVNDARVRKIINHIRINGLVAGLIASSEGYYIAQTDLELQEYEASLKGREDAIRAVRQSIHKQRIQLFHTVTETEIIFK
jgi:hypothetical protein